MNQPSPDSGACEVIQVPNKLRQKVSGNGRFDPELIQQAEQAILSKASQFRITASEEADKMLAYLASARETGETDDAISEIYEIAHNLKGQGATFGYTLLTQVSGSMCRFIEKASGPGSQHLKVIGPHIDAIRAILNQDVQGGGDPVGIAIVDGLQKLIQKAA